MRYLSTYFRRVRQRRMMNDLMELDDYRLSDIGLTRQDLFEAMLTRKSAAWSHE